MRTSPLITALTGNLVITPASSFKSGAGVPAGLRYKCWSPPPEAQRYIKRLWIAGYDAFCTWMANPVVIVFDNVPEGIPQPPGVMDGVGDGVAVVVVSGPHGAAAMNIA